MGAEADVRCACRYLSHQPSGLWWCATMRMCTRSIRGKLAPRHEALKPDPVP